jgi:hypothetical protein
MCILLISNDIATDTQIDQIGNQEQPFPPITL